MDNGKKCWYFADGYLPFRGRVENAGFQGHEAVMLLNCNETDAHVLIDIYFENRAPIRDIPITVRAERILCVRMDRPEEIGGAELGRQEQYSLRIKSDVNIVAQYGRMDVAQPNLAYIGLMGYHE